MRSTDPQNISEHHLYHFMAFRNIFKKYPQTIFLTHFRYVSLIRAQRGQNTQFSVLWENFGDSNVGFRRCCSSEIMLETYSETSKYPKKTISWMLESYFGIMGTSFFGGSIRQGDRALQSGILRLYFPWWSQSFSEVFTWWKDGLTKNNCPKRV